MDFEVLDVPAATYAVIRKTVSFAELPQTVGPILEEVHAWAHAQGPHGPMMAISSMAGDGRLNVAPGVEVDGSAEPPAPIELVRTPDQRAAVHVHVGPYDELPDVYRQLSEAMVAAGHTPGAEPREIYVSHDDGPTTRIIWPLA